MMLSENMLIILAGAAATYLTRMGGHVVLSHFRSIHPRIEAGLNAVPAAVLTTLVAPSLLTGGPAEIAALAATVLASARFGMLGLFLAGAATIIGLRMLTG